MNKVKLTASFLGRLFRVDHGLCLALSILDKLMSNTNEKEISFIQSRAGLGGIVFPSFLAKTTSGK